MEMMEKLPFYRDYLHLLDNKKIAEDRINDLESSEPFERLKRFYRNVGADYKKNQWMAVKELKLSWINGDKESLLNQFQHDVQLGSVVENAVEKQDDESLSALSAYENDIEYRHLVRSLVFYINVNKVKKSPRYIKGTGAAIMNRYDPTYKTLFAEEGVIYYIFYLQCLQSWLKRYRDYSQYETVKQMVFDSCKDIKKALNSFADDPLIGNEVKSVLTELSNIEDLMREIMKEQIFAYVQMNENKLRLNRYSFQPSIVKEKINHNSELTTYECEGVSFGPRRAYCGFFYSKPEKGFLGSRKDPEKYWEKSREKEKDYKYYHTESICGDFYYYEEYETYRKRL